MPGTPSSPHLVGRIAELATLDEGLRRADDGAPTVVLVGGDAGLGKSRLVAEFATGARDHGARVLIGGCLDLGGEGLPYHPFLEVLRALGDELPPTELGRLLGDTAPELARLAPGFGRYVGADGAAEGGGATSTAPPAPAPTDQARLFELILAMLDRLGAERPLVVILEDLHWSDVATGDLFVFLARNLRRGRILIIGTFRTHDMMAGHPLLVRLAELGRGANVERVDLRPLDLAEQREQLSGILGRPADLGLAERIHARAQGNPFYAEELLASELGDASSSVPASLREILAGRIATVSDAARRVLRAASVAGSHADDPLLAAATGLAEEELEGALREIVGQHILEVDTRSGTYRYRHALLAEVVDADLLPGERRRLHDVVARWLANPTRLEAHGPAATPADLALHWSAAGNAQEALVASVRAAHAATAIHAHADALRQAERAIATWDRVPDAVERVGMDRAELLRFAADAADLAGASERAVELARLALDHIDPAADPVRAGLVHSRLGFYRWLTGESQAMIDEHRIAIELIPADPPSVERALVVGGLASALMPTGRYRESRALCEEAIDTLRATGSHDGESRLLNVLGVDLVGLGEVDAGLDHLRRAVDIGRVAGPPESQLAAQHNLAFFLAQTDHLDEALAVATDGLESARRVGLELRFGAGLRASAGDTLLRSGRWAEADRITLEGLEREDVDRSGSLYLRATRVMLLAARGERDAMAAELAELTPSMEADIDPDVRAYVLQASAEAALLGGRPAEAIEDIEGALAAFEGSDEVLLVAPLIVVGMAAAADLAETARAFRDRGGAAAAEAAAAAFGAAADGLEGRDAGPAASTPSVVAAVATARAEATRVLGNPDPAAWTAAAAAWDVIPMPYPAARARARAAEAMLLARGPREAAAQLLREAHRSAIALGAGPLRDQIEAVAGRARVDLEAKAARGTAARDATGPTLDVAGTPAPRGPAEILGLSAREWEVLELVAAGRSNGEIAETLFISPKTASVHVTHILDKLGVNSRVEAAAMAIRIGLPEPAADDHGGRRPERQARER